MRSNAKFCLLMVGAAAIFSLPLHAEEPPSQVARELAVLQEAVGRLERKVDRLLEQPSEFSRVEVRVIDEQRQPMSDFKVTLTSSGQAQHAKASGVSNEEGIALSRQLPYGVYQMSVTGHGWYARDPVTVEVGAPLELSVVAPSPDQFGELVLEASLSRDELVGLRFGGWMVEHDSGWARRIAPEPGEGARDENVQVEVVQQESDGWTSFPTVSDGIETAAVVVALAVSRRVEQPDGSLLTWQWRPSRSDAEPRRNLRWLVQSDGTLRPLLNETEKQVQIDSRTGWFAAVASDGESEEEQIVSLSPSDRRLGYSYLQLGEEHRGRARMQLPAGQVQLSADDMYGRPTQDVLDTIGAPADSSAGQLWLPAVVTRNSRWLDRVLGSSMTVDEDGAVSRGFSTEVDLAADDTRTVTVGAGKADGSP